MKVRLHPEIASYPGFPMFFNISHKLLKNVGRPGYEAMLEIPLSLRAFLSILGPLHGLANQEVLVWLTRLQEQLGKEVTNEQLTEFIWTTLKNGQVEYKFLN